MDYFQGVVTEYLRADRAVFVNTECCIQINAADNPDTSGPHWYCDAVAVNFRDSAVFLCEVSYSKSLEALIKRLAEWSTHWAAVCAALARDCSLPATWAVRPWLFVPESRRDGLAKKLSKFPKASEESFRMPEPKITSLESITPWMYSSWNRRDDHREDDA
jgi:hypothetical protein